MSIKKVLGEVTKEKLKELEAEYGEVKEILLDVVKREIDGEEKEIYPAVKFYLKKPNRGVLKLSEMEKINSKGKVDVGASGEVILKNCFVDGYDVKVEDHYYFRAVNEALKYGQEIMGLS